MGKGTILYIGNFELPDKGASANRVMTNRKLFAALGYRVAYLGVTREGAFEGVRGVSYDGDIFERAYPSSVKMWLERCYSIKDIVETAAKYDDLTALMFYNTPYSLVRVAWRYYRKLGIKILYDCTEWSPDADGGKLKRAYKKYDVHRIRYDLEKVTDGIIVVSSLMEKQYRKKPTLRLPPLVDLSDPMWQTERTRNDGVFEFCYAGDPENKDDLCLLIDAFLALGCENTRLKIIGVKKEDFVRTHPGYEEKMDENVVFTGRIPHEEVIQALCNTSCFIFIRPSNLRNNAGFPTKFVEAYSVGTKIIATDISDIGVYRDEGIFLLKQCDVQSVTQVLRENMEINIGNKSRDAFDFRGYIGKTGEFFS